jgi:preprotein translocase subunit SecG
MNRHPNFRPFLAILLAGGIIVPVAICVVFGVGTMLTAMGDSAGGGVLSRVSLALAILWILDLIVLVLFQSLNSLLNSSVYEDQQESEVELRPTQSNLDSRNKSGE